MEDKSVVELLRNKNEEADFDSMLKTTLGGYNKKSVVEYITNLKKEQQKAVNTFNKTYQSLIDEKEKLTDQISALNEKLRKSDAEYRSLTEAIDASHDDEDEKNLTHKLMTLSAQINVLKQEKNDVEASVKDKDIEVRKLSAVIKEKDKEIEVAGKNLQVTNESLAAAKIEAAEARAQISELANSLDGIRKENKFLENIVSEGAIAKLNEKIENLLSDITKQSELIVNKDREIKSLNEAVATLTSESAALMSANAQLRQVNEEIIIQNEKLSAANNEILNQLKSAYSEKAELFSQMSDLAVEKALLSRKLDAANARLEILGYEEKVSELAVAEKGSDKK